MSTTETIMEKVSALPPEKQEEVLHYIESLTDPAPPVKSGEPYSALRVAMNMKLDGPGDWSERFEDYLQETRTKHGGA